MRRFFLGNQELASCGIGQKPKGWKFFCKTCGEIWGTVSGVEKTDWFCVAQPCPEHGTKFSPGGSFLRPLIWWDEFNGNSLEKQLNSFDEKVLRHEALMAAEWVLEREKA